jgi:hypothetical protein
VKNRANFLAQDRVSPMMKDWLVGGSTARQPPKTLPSGPSECDVPRS